MLQTTSLALLVLSLVSCESAVIGSAVFDGGVSHDGGADGSVVDADVTCANECEYPDAGRSLGVDCNALLDQCGAGLTCGYGTSEGNPRGVTLDGVCRLLGPLGEGDVCVDEDNMGPGTPGCGEAMGCGPLPRSIGRCPCFCQIMCDVDDPLKRCTLDQTCEPISLAEPRLGYCCTPSATGGECTVL